TPLPEIVTRAPDWKFVPLTTIDWKLKMRRIETGVTAVIVGADTTLNPLDRVDVPPPGPVTTTLREPSVALGSMVTTTVRRFELLRVTELTVMPLPNETVPPAVVKTGSKPEPLICTERLAAPWRPDVGLTLVTTGFK